MGPNLFFSASASHASERPPHSATLLVVPESVVNFVVKIVVNFLVMENIGGQKIDNNLNHKLNHSERYLIQPPSYELPAIKLYHL